MLWFLSISAKHKFVVESYTDCAVGVMSENEEGKLAITSIHLYPQMIFCEDRLPAQEEIEAMH